MDELVLWLINVKMNRKVVKIVVLKLTLKQKWIKQSNPVCIVILLSRSKSKTNISNQKHPVWAKNPDYNLKPVTYNNY